MLLGLVTVEQHVPLRNPSSPGYQTNCPDFLKPFLSQNLLRKILYHILHISHAGHACADQSICSTDAIKYKMNWMILCGPRRDYGPLCLWTLPGSDPSFCKYAIRRILQPYKKVLIQDDTHFDNRIHLCWVYPKENLLTKHAWTDKC